MRPLRSERAKRAANKASGVAHKVRFIVVRVVLVVLALAVCAVVPLFVNDIIGYLPLIAVVLVLILSFVYMLILWRSLSFNEDSLLASCERGSDIDFVLHFRNRSPLVFLRLEVSIYVSDLFDEADTVTTVPLVIMPFENKEFRFQAMFDHIGTYSAGIQKIVIYDLLGLFVHTIVNHKRHQVEVLPRLFEADNVPLSSEVSSEAQRPRQALTVDDMDYAGVRDYEWGDSMKTIHWKLSAREPSGDYLTRLFETYNNPGLAIILDTSSPKYDRDSLMFIYDGIVESALSINELALSQGIDSVLSFRSKFGEDHTLRIMSYLDFGDLTSVLPRIQVGDGYEAQELLRREINTLHGQDNVAFCTAHVDEETISAMISLKNRKRNPIMFVVVPPSLGSDDIKEFVRPLRRLDESGVSYFVISSAADLGVERIVDDNGEIEEDAAVSGSTHEVGAPGGGDAGAGVAA